MIEEEIICVLFMPCTHGKNLKHRVLSAFFRVFRWRIFTHPNLLNLLGFLNFDERYENFGKSTCTMIVQ